MLKNRRDRHACGSVAGIRLEAASHSTDLDNLASRQGTLCTSGNE